MAVLLVFNGNGKLPVVETVHTTAEALERYADDPSCIIIEGRVLTVQTRTVTLLDGQPADTPRLKEEVRNADANQWMCPAAPGTPGTTEHTVDVVGGVAGESSPAPSPSAGERSDTGGTGTASGTSAGVEG